ncbi:MAG: UDP-N-acetylmuramoyl-tripeptide--D-alanyl-D-alanine ligase [Polaromonas sp.]|nr:UDP-N-acetylmuramoyl-tripeptide--D-alanyl-D-alanine ligase [Polaromonas sp.]
MMTLAQAQQHLPMATWVGDASVRFSRVHTDTRSLRDGDLFVALKGERFDAHDFLSQAASHGAVAVLAEHGLPQAGLPGLQVPDSKAALGQLAAAWRAQFSLPLIAVTGSNGKTTVTQMIASILRAFKGEQAFATEGNFNNDIGVPLTLLRLRADHAAGVVELGMNHPGEIAGLAAMAQPTVALVNNAQREHLEFMASVEAVARENGAVLSALPTDGVAVFPADEDYSPLWRALAGKRRVMTFALTGQADVTASAEWNGMRWQVNAQTPLGLVTFELNVAGRHNVKNALAATACALAAGVPLSAIAEGLTNFAPVKGRSRALPMTLEGRALIVIDDSYNANPDSVRAAIDVLAELPAPRLLVLGDMGEVGDRGPEFHTEIGAYALQRGIEQLVCTGELTLHAAEAFQGARHHLAFEALMADVQKTLPDCASVLVKGSRFMKMERVVDAISTPAGVQVTATAAAKEKTCS